MAILPAIAVLIVLYDFALSSVMLFIGVEGPMQVVLTVIPSLIGIFGVSAGSEGYIFTSMNPVQRILSAVSPFGCSRRCFVKRSCG